MNDKTELRHALDYCSGKYAKKGAMMGFIEGLIVRLQNERLPLSAFDLLEQWRGYGSASLGVSLGFDIDLLTAILSEQGMSREVCLYDDDNKKQRIDSLSTRSIARQKSQQHIIDTSDNDRQIHQAERAMGYGFGAEVAEFMRQQTLAFKDNRFKAEREVRFISDFLDAGSLLAE